MSIVFAFSYALLKDGDSGANVGGGLAGVWLAIAGLPWNIPVLYYVETASTGPRLLLASALILAALMNVGWHVRIWSSARDRS